MIIQLVESPLGIVRCLRRRLRWLLPLVALVVGLYSYDGRPSTERHVNAAGTPQMKQLDSKWSPASLCGPVPFGSMGTSRARTARNCRIGPPHLAEAIISACLRCFADTTAPRASQTTLLLR